MGGAVDEGSERVARRVLPREMMIAFIHLAAKEKSTRRDTCGDPISRNRPFPSEGGGWERSPSGVVGVVVGRS